MRLHHREWANMYFSCACVASANSFCISWSRFSCANLVLKYSSDSIFRTCAISISCAFTSVNNPTLYAATRRGCSKNMFTLYYYEILYMLSKTLVKLFLSNTFLLFIIYYLLFIIYYLLFIIYYLLFIIYIVACHAF